MSSSNTTDLLDRLPPQDLDAEQGVLGSIFLDPDRIDDVALLLRAEDFYLPAHRTIYATMLQLRNAGKGVDDRLVISAMRRQCTLEDAGGISYIAEVANASPSPFNAVWYAEHVKECSLLRSMIHAGTEMLSEGYHGSGTPRERMSRAESRVLELLEHGVAKHVRQIGDVLRDAISEIDERTRRGSVSGISTGFIQLDQMMGGMRPGELIILAARPSHGKSALASNIVEYASVRGGHASLFVSLEMTGQELGERMLASVAHVNGHALRSGFLKEDDRARIVLGSAEIAQAPMFIDDSPQRNMVEIASAARRMKRTENLGLLVVDYLQLIEPDNRREPREQQVAVISRRLKHLARELKIPVMCLAQLNREAEKEGDVPRLSHLRESGAIEQDADVVLFIHREDMYRPPDKWDSKATVVVAKNRNGQRGRISLDWNAGYTRFENPKSDWDPAEHAYPGDGF